MIIDVSDLSNKQFKDSLIELSKICSKVTLNINEYCNLMGPNENGQFVIDSITDRDTLKTGLYAKIGNMKIIVSKLIRPGEIEVE